MRRDLLYHLTGICLGLVVIVSVYFITYRDSNPSPEIGRAIAYHLVPGDQIGVVQIAALKALTRNAEIVPVFKLSATCGSDMPSIRTAAVRSASLVSGAPSGDTITVSVAKSPLEELCLRWGKSSSGLLAVADLRSWTSLRDAGLRPPISGPLFARRSHHSTFCGLLHAGHSALLRNRLASAKAY